MSAMPVPKKHLLHLPYEIRLQIYQYLFPTDNQLYVQAEGGALRVIGPAAGQCVPTSLFRANRGLGTEALEFFYNYYLFNIIGSKRECLASFPKFQATMSRYARVPASIQAFDNGPHSGTMCVSISSGENKIRVLKLRRRGAPREIPDIEKELASRNSVGTSTSWSVTLCLLAVVAAAMATLVGWWTAT